MKDWRLTALVLKQDDEGERDTKRNEKFDPMKLWRVAPPADRSASTRIVSLAITLIAPGAIEGGAETPSR
jgi:hypothetical protein